MTGMGWVLLAWCGRVGWAAPEAPPDDPPPAQTDDERARTLFLEGDAHYAAGRYEQAAAAFEEAFALSGRPLLLFNLANVYERMSDYERAAESLRRYLDSGTAQDVVSVRERLRRLELALQFPEPAPPTPAPAVAAPVPVPPPPPPVSRPPAWPTVVLASGASVATVSAVTFGVWTQLDRGVLGTQCATGPTGETLCQPGAADRVGREPRLALATDVSVGVAASTATAAVVHAWVRHSRIRRSEAR